MRHSLEFDCKLASLDQDTGLLKDFNAFLNSVQFIDVLPVLLVIIDLNKKVLLRERKRHTVSSTTRGGVPPIGHLPARSDRWVPEVGYPLLGYPQPGLRGSTQWGTPWPGLMGGTRWGTLPHQRTPWPGPNGGVPEVGYPHQGTPCQVRQGYMRWGTPQLDLAGVPPYLDLAGVPPQVWTDRQTRVKT